MFLICLYLSLHHHQDDDIATRGPKPTVLDARLYRVYLLHLLCSGTFVPGTEFRELNFLLVVPWKVFPEQIIVEVLGPQRAYRPEISRQGCLQGCGCGGRRQYYCFRFTMNHVIHPNETPPRLLAGEGGGAFSRFVLSVPGTLFLELCSRNTKGVIGIPCIILRSGQDLNYWHLTLLQ